MNNVSITSTSGHTTLLTLSDISAQTIKQSLITKEVPFLIQFDNQDIWINPKNIYFIHIEDVKEKIK